MLNISDGISVEEVQNQVEVALMAEKYFAVAKSYMLYRQKHTEDREVSEKLKFLMDYCNASNAATGSKFDANANVENKNMATLIGELPKSNFIRLNRRMLTDRIKEMYGKEVADKYIELLNNHFIYKNDETSLANYCASITMYPWLIGGTNSIGGNSKAPTNLKSFSGGFVNMVFMVSSMLSGACATPEFLMYMNYFIGLEYGRDYHKNADQVVDLSKKQRTLDKMITDYFEQIVYSINQPTGARNFQAVFWNISYYDKFYFESLFENFVFPDGSKPDWDSLSWLQKRFNAITCICFMGGDSEPDEVDRLAVHLRRSIKQPIKTAWYSGKQNIPKSCNLHNFDYIKLGAYIEELGGLDSLKTNPRLYKITNEQMEDITNHFQKQKQ